MRISRRNALSVLAMGAFGATYPTALKAKENSSIGRFRYCLNTSTISGQSPGLLTYIDLASKAGYDGIEVWVRDVEAALEAGHTLSSLKAYIADQGLKVESAIGFAPWMSEGDSGLIQMKKEMEMLAGIDCQRIAAPPAGLAADKELDLFAVGMRYRKLLALGRETGVMPQLEFWGSSPMLWHLGQVLLIAAVADDPDAKILPDLKNMGGEKILSLELFNRTYWKEDPLKVAKTGLDKMKALVREIA